MINLVERGDVVDILLVDDDKNDAEFAQISLKALMPRARIVTKVNGQEALNYLNRFTSNEDPGFPSVMLLDMNMPFLDGLGLLHIIRRDSVLEALPVIVLSGQLDPTTVRQAYSAGANAVVPKPSDFHAYRDVTQAIVDFWFHTAHPIGGTARHAV